MVRLSVRVWLICVHCTKPLSCVCLVRPLQVKVCFDETQLEQVFEYPSEASMIAFTPYPIPGQEKGKEDEVQEEEEEEERGVFVSGSSRNVGAAAGLRVLRIGQYMSLPSI